MSTVPTSRPARSGFALELLASVLIPAGVLALICLVAPTERTMGHAQRVVYVHVAMAWLALTLFLIMAASGAAYLVRRNLAWDHWAQAAAELGWLAASLTLATGSLWAHSAWNTWWTWDPRLLTPFILWAMYSGMLLLRTCLEEPHRRARLGAVLAIVGLLDVPLVVMATRWFRGVHPVSPKMDPTMRLVLLASVVGFSIVYGLLLRRRQRQVRDEFQVAEG